MIRVLVNNQQSESVCVCVCVSFRSLSFHSKRLCGLFAYESPFHTSFYTAILTSFVPVSLLRGQGAF